MDDSLFRRQDYEYKLRRETRKLADKLHRAHKRQLLKELENQQIIKLPVFKIDITPIAPSKPLLEFDGVRQIILNFINPTRGLPKTVPLSTIDGLIVNSNGLQTNQSFDQLYFGENGHIGLRCETMFNLAADTKVFELDGAITRLSYLIDIAKKLYGLQKVDPALMIRIELSEILDWRINVTPSPSDDETTVAVLPRYVVEKSYSPIGASNFQSIGRDRIAISLIGILLNQLGISSQ